VDRFELENTGLNGLFHIKPKPIGDNRGYFERLFCEKEFSSIGMEDKIVNINHSYTRAKGAIRGLHFQLPPYAEDKIVMCLKGAVYDVAVDNRRGSNTFLRWHAETLRGEDRNMLYIPKGFMHGFQALEEETEILYFTTAHYSKEYERGFRFDDPTVGIPWPLPVSETSERDKLLPLIDIGYDGVEI